MQAYGNNSNSVNINKNKDGENINDLKKPPLYVVAGA